MKVLHINTKYYGGGAASVARHIHEYINSKTEYESFFLYGRGKKGDKYSSCISNKLDVLTGAFTSRYLGKQVNLFFYKEIEEKIEASDVIHLHNIHGYYINFEKLIKMLEKYNKPIVWTLHDVWAFTGRCAIPNDCDKWVEGCDKCEFTNIYPKTYIDKSNYLWAYKNKTFNLLPKDKIVIVSPSNWLADQVNKSYLQNFDIKVIPNGVNSNCYSKLNKQQIRKELNLPLNNKLVLFVAPDLKDERKGLKYILDIINKLNNNIKIVCVGNKIKGIQELDAKLIQLGYISDSALLNKIYKACDLFVNTSLGETFSLTTAEAFSSMLPVVAFDVGPMRELIGNDCGLLVKLGDIQDLQHSIELILSNEDKLKQFSQNTIKKYNNKYTYQKCIESYIECYKQLIMK